MKILPAWTVPLRDWQHRAVSAVLAHQTADFLAMATPAAGKTCFALRVAHDFMTKRAAVRVLVVCPTSHLRTQWSEAAGKIGLHLDPALTNEQATEASDYHGAAVTYQQVCPRRSFNGPVRVRGPCSFSTSYTTPATARIGGRRCERRLNRRCFD